MKKGLFLIIALFVLLFTAACGNNETTSEENTGENAAGEGSSDEQEMETNISIGTHQPGVAYHSAGSGIATVVSENSPVSISVKTFSGPNSWMPLLNSGELELGLTNAIDMGWAYRGKGGYQKSENLRLLVNGNTTQNAGFTVPADSKIESISDLKGKTVAANYAGNQIIQKFLEAHLLSAGLTWDDVQQVPVTSVGEGLDALRAGRVDAAFTGTPTGAINLEADAAIGLKVLNWGEVTPDKIDTIPADVIQKIDDLLPGARIAPFKGGFLEEEHTLIKYDIVLTASTHLSEDAAYEVVKALWENYEELQPIFAWLKTWSPETMIKPEFSVPYHAGAVKFFKEKGLWTEEYEKRQQELLNM